MSDDAIVEIIKVVGAIAVAVIAKIGTGKIRNEPKPGPPEEQAPEKSSFSIRTLIPWIVIGISGVAAYFLLGFLITLLQPPPEVAISVPTENQLIEVTLSDGPGSFTVNGTSERVAADPNLRVYVLIHPAVPNAAGWWIQVPATVRQDGEWDAIGWIGSSAAPPEVGHKIDIVAIAAGPDLNIGEKINDPKDVRPSAQSDTIRVEIETLK